MNNYYMDFIVL